MSKPKFLKPLLIGCACLIPIGLVVGLSVNWNHIKNISCVGSGGVKPFVEAFGENFSKSYSNYDVTCESGGSSFGLEQVAYEYCNLGSVSKNPYDELHKDGNSDLLNQWKNKQIKTVTLGWEAVGILYLVPDGLSKTTLDNLDLYVCDTNINDLYAAFSGFNETYVDNKVVKLSSDRTSFYNFLTPAAKAVVDQNANDAAILKKTQIAPIVRSGGSTAANSAYSFANESGLKVNLTPNQAMAFAGGQYGLDRQIIQTDESNAKGYKAFDDLEITGSMVYLTSAFTEPESNKKIIASHSKYKFMSYQATGSQTISKYNFDNIASGYEWVRPINVCIELSGSKASDSKKFVEYIFRDISFDEDKSSYKKTIKKVGAKPITLNQYESMAAGGNFWSSDTRIEETRTPDKKKIYGALK